MKSIAIFVSGRGSNFISIHSYIKLGVIPAKIALVVSNNSNSEAIKYAVNNQIRNIIVNNIRYPKISHRNNFLITALIQNKIDLICLAGYMKLLPISVVKAFEKRILNIHPALLPDFGGKGCYGIKVHEKVISSGVDTSGITIHFVYEEYDKGEIIFQKKIDVLKNDNAKTLAARILKLEHKLYPLVIKAFCEDKIVWKNNNPRIEVKIDN